MSEAPDTAADPEDLIDEPNVDGDEDTENFEDDEDDGADD